MIVTPFMPRRPGAARSGRRPSARAAVHHCKYFLREFGQGGYVTVGSDVVSGRERKVYTLTDKGRDAFRVGLEAWMDATNALLETGREAKVRKAGRHGCKC
jgi:hypothetical protein